METKVTDDGFAYIGVCSRDEKRAVQFMTMCVKHPRNKDTLWDAPLPMRSPDFH